ncbi:inner-membrane translocator [Streptomyces sp. NPDC052023]|uniref:inner-membrane translocator n=1 Tax=Streptomyces sp. NPDC052023 TaxID=3365681 RepID=UPI0037CE0F12
MADVAAGLLVVILLAVRGLGRLDAGVSKGAAGPPPADLAPLVCFGALALAIGLTGLVLLRMGHRVIGTGQLVVCLVVAGHAMGAWT